MFKKMRGAMVSLCLLEAIWLGGLSSAAEPSAKLSTYETPAGETYFALALNSGQETDVAEARDLLVMFDTSASQTGTYRDDALTALDKLLGSLGAKDRVKLVAVDLDAIPLTEDFVAADSMSMRMALRKLDRRIPLGSTDMAGTMRSAAASFTVESGNPRAAVYIGDGMTRGNLMNDAEFASAVESLVAKRVSVSCYVVGPSRGMHLMAALANQTGGRLLVDSDAADAPLQAGIALSHYIHATVAWPTSVKYTAGMSEVLPARVPPLRSDRDSVLIGTLSERGPQKIDVVAEVAGKTVDLSWQVTPAKATGDIAYVPKLLEMGRASGGAALPILGSDGLREAGRVMMQSANKLSQLGGRALAAGDRQGAQRMAEAALATDPGNPAATALRSASGGGSNEPLRLVNFDEEGGADLLHTVEEEGFFLNDVTNADAIIQEKIKTEVVQGLKVARDKMGIDSEGAKQDLKLLLENVERAPRLEPDVRAELRLQIQSAVREASRRAIAEHDAKATEEQNLATAQEAQRISDELLRKGEKLRQLTARFNSLMEEGRYVEAEEQVAEQMRVELPESEAAEAQVWWARNLGNVDKMYKLREVRHRKFVDALFQVEKAHVPFPDEPPILYPDPEVWEELTLRRKKYASVDLAERGSAEQAIYDALEDDTHFEFIETPLSDVVAYLQDLHKVQIQLDTKSLDGVGIGTDTPISRSLTGISLRSALRLLLKDLELTYVIQDEVLMITTPEVAEENLITKVYPVGDLVLPISSQAGANPFSLGGGLGGGGGFGGGLGGWWWRRRWRWLRRLLHGRRLLWWRLYGRRRHPEAHDTPLGWANLGQVASGSARFRIAHTPAQRLVYNPEARLFPISRASFIAIALRRFPPVLPS